jgi:8-oxo-dGTP pyrophosphatase MutT (NUDIX family)
MAYIDHIRTCNNHDLSNFVPFYTPDDLLIGHIHAQYLLSLNEFPDILEVNADKVSIKHCDDLTAAMKAVCDDLRAQGLIPNWRDEAYRVSRTFADQPIFEMERAATPLFGIRGYGVHINGYVKKTDGLYMWVARRAKDRAICPGMLDNMVAGGQPAGLSLQENIIKECAEEAGMDADLAKLAKPVGMVSYAMETDGGLKPDVLFCYDIELPESFTPENTDGEVESFQLMPISEVAEIVKNTFEFKFNCNLVIIDFLIRHGFINPDTEKDYEALVTGLR